LTTRRPPLPTLFPSRRSSDLVHQPEPLGNLAAGIGIGRRRKCDTWHVREAVLQQRQRQIVGAEVMAPLGNAVSLIDGKQSHLHRSEEHTSELQSRENLVCRLL